MANKYFGENTVQMNKCALSTVQASMTAPVAAQQKRLRHIKCLLNPTLSSHLRAVAMMATVAAELQYMGPIQFDTKVKRATVVME